MTRFSITNLLVAMLLFWVGIMSGSWSRDVTWQDRIHNDAEKLASNTITYCRYNPESGDVWIRHVGITKLKRPRQTEIIETLCDRNGINLDN